jgi:hypothetical protein
MSSSDSETLDSGLAKSDASEYEYSSQYLLYEGEPLVPLGEDITQSNIVETKEVDLDGLTPAILEATYYKKVNVDSW